MPQVRLSHAIARHSAATTKNKNTITGGYHAIQRSEGLSGFSKTYQKTAEDSADFPPQSKLLQIRAYDVLDEVTQAMGELIDADAVRCYGNAEATADVTVDGTVLIHDAPPTLLLNLETLATDLRTFVSKLPILPPDERWVQDHSEDCYRSETPQVTNKEKPVKKPLVLYPHSDKHPAQTAIVDSTEVVGKWTTTNFSGGVTRQDKKELVKRATKLLDAVKQALHECNATKTEDQHPSQEFLGYVLDGIQRQ